MVGRQESKYNNHRQMVKITTLLTYWRLRDKTFKDVFKFMDSAALLLTEAETITLYVQKTIHHEIGIRKRVVL
jgi:hypothetical protein